jgi:hypothetical protein
VISFHGGRAQQAGETNAMPFSELTFRITTVRFKNPVKAADSHRPAYLRRLIPVGKRVK